MTRKRRRGPTSGASAAARPDVATRTAVASRRVVLRLVVAAVVLVAAIGGFLWLDARPARDTDAPRAEHASQPDAQYVGDKACADCHAAQATAWRGSDHDLAMQAADERSVLGDFAGATFAYAGTTSTFRRRDGRYFVTTDGPDGKLADFEVKYTFGVRPLQQYLIELPGGRMQALGIAWDSRPKAQGGQRWFHLYPGQRIKAGDWLHWTGGGQNWNSMCAECHSTNLHKSFDAASATYQTTWSALNVSCEACHGPGSAHALWARKEGDWKALDATKGLALALDERKGVSWTPVAASGNARRSVPRGSSRELDTCARCHGRASRISDDYVHGKPPLDTHRRALLDEGLYFDDGQMRDEVYDWGSFAQSRMHANGVTCSDCHDPHTLKLRAPGNAVCAQCHQPAKYDGPGHTHHAAGTPGAACASCHLPTRTYMGVDARHDHSMRIPRPDQSATLGVPNACNGCHAKQSPQWAADAIAAWTGKPPTGFQQFGPAFRAGSTGAPGAQAALLALIDDPAQPAVVRASAIARLGRWMAPSTLPGVSRALDDADASVRLAAVEVLANGDPAIRLRSLPRMLGDPVRSVRIEAARGLAGPAEARLAAGDRPRFERAIAEFAAVQTYNADRPEGRSALGNLYAVRGDPEAAIAQFRRAIEIDPAFVPAYVNLADVYRARGAEGDAETILRAGVAKVPDAAPLRHALGLVLVRQKRTAEAVTALADAARLDPDNGRYAYVYAVAVNDAGDPRRALTILKQALGRQPYDRDVLFGLAFYAQQAGRRDAALGYAKTLRDLEPENPDVAQLVARLEGRPR